MENKIQSNLPDEIKQLILDDLELNEYFRRLKEENDEDEIDDIESLEEFELELKKLSRIILKTKNNKKQFAFAY